MKKTTITLLLTFIMTLFIATGPTTAGTTKRVSVDSSGAEGNDQSWFPTKVSANGKIAFGSDSTNLVNGDNNNKADAFVHDLNTGETIRVSVDSMGAEANGWSDQHIDLSTNGNTVSFASEASNLVANDTNGFQDIFVHDLETGTTDRVSLANDGSEGNKGVWYFNVLSADGSVVAFDSQSSNLVAGDTNGAEDIFVRDRNSNSTERVSVAFDGSEANSYSSWPAISGDGNIVLFTSRANNLIPGGTTAGTEHTYTYDRTTGAIEIVDVATDGTEANSWSDDSSVGGSNNEIIAFRSSATNLVTDDTNGFNDVFVRDMSTGVTKRVSVASDGSEANGKSDCWNGSVSDDGRFVVFNSLASNLVPNDTNGKDDIFVHELSTGITERVSIASDGAESNGWTSWLVYISADGRYVSFESDATNLVTNDNNGSWDIFVHDRYDDDGDGYASVVYGYDDCDDTDATVYPGAAEVRYDGIDQDCNGYDLTIDVTVADYIEKDSMLTVKAISSYGESANLELVGYGPMIWRDHKQEWMVDIEGANPGTVTVSGPEGSWTQSVVVE